MNFEFENHDSLTQPVWRSFKRYDFKLWVCGQMQPCFHKMDSKNK